jgi:mono/diheme cytochrome c family protein
MRKLQASAVAALFLSLFAAEGHASDRQARVAAGASLARDACSACHQVSRAQKRPAPVFDPDQQAGVPAPSFMKIARDPRKDAAYLRGVITRPHYPMREQSYDKDDLDAIVAYILSLRPRPRSPSGSAPR